MKQRGSFFFGPTKPFTPSELARAWSAHRDEWLARAAEYRTQEAAFSLLDELSVYADGAGFAMVPYIVKGFGMTDVAAADLLAAWEVARQSE